MAEDNPQDVFLLEEALKEVQADCGVTAVKDGEACLSLLSRCGPGGKEPLPDLLLLDLNLPGKSGRQILETIKRDPKLRDLQVMVLTGSTDPGDLSACSDLRADAFMIKPGEATQFLQLADYIKKFCRGKTGTAPIWTEPHSEKVCLPDVRKEGDGSFFNAREHLKQALEESGKDLGHWANLLMLASHLRAAWDILRKKTEEEDCADGLYDGIRRDAPWLAARIGRLVEGVKQLEIRTAKLVKVFGHPARMAPGRLERIPQTVAALLREAGALMAMEDEVVFEQFNSPPALD